MKIYILFIALSFLSISCIPDEDPVQAFDRGDAIIAQVAMGELYNTQIYYSLSANQAEKSNPMTAWDIAFADSDSDERIEILLNYCQMAKAYKVTDKSYDEINLAYANALKDADWKYDNPKGDLDSLAIAGWYSKADKKVIDNVFILDRGMDEKAKQLGKYKLKITDYANKTYFLTYTNLKTNETKSVQVKKSGKYNYQQLSLTDGSVLQLEPEKESWDLLFTKYTTLLYTDAGEPQWYGVTSVLINPFYVEVAKFQDSAFASINKSIIDTLSFANNRDAIGHEWKTYKFDTGSYIVDTKSVFIVKSADGFYYKFHFIDFYNDAGIKGYPKYEFKML